MDKILEQLEKHEISLKDAKKQLEDLQNIATIDYDRQKRTGAGEVIYGAGKSVEQITYIVEQMLDHKQSNILVTGLCEEKYLALKDRFPMFEYDKEAKTWLLSRKVAMNKGKIVVVCAGTSDLFVAKEAINTARFLGNHVQLISDVGVAGIHRLLARMEEIKQANAIIAVAGMEGALPSVIAGMVDKPVIAVPTSVGYGANLQGITTMMAMLTSCASGISVVNINNGFGAAFMAHRINSIGGKE